MLKEKLFEAWIKASVHIKQPTKLLQNPSQLEAGRWFKVNLDSICTDGSKSNMYLKKGTTNNLILFFNGGGVSWNKESARHPTTVSAMLNKQPTLYTPRTDEIADYSLFLSNKGNGMLGNDETNPFRTWNMAVINYATADFHVGQNKVAYEDAQGEQKYLHCYGYRNFQESMKKVQELFPAPEKLIITGGSAGAFAVPALAGDIIEMFPQCKDITAYADSALGIIPEWPSIVREHWNAPEHIASVVHSDNVSADWFAALRKNYGNRIRYLFSCSTHDNTFSAFENYIRTQHFEITQAACDTFFQELKEHVARLKAENPEIGIFINQFPSSGGAVGTEHCVIHCERFTKTTDSGKSTCDWLLDAVNGNVYDVGLEYLD